MPNPNISMVMSALLAEQLASGSRNVDIDSDRFMNLNDSQLQNILDWLFESNQIQGYRAFEGFFVVNMLALEE